MIGHLDDTLKNLLHRDLPFLPKEKIFFEAPDRDFKPSFPAIDLFLYDVRENVELRSNEWQTLRGNGLASRQQAPVRVDCSYLITAWAGDVKGEHTLLGEVMRVLLRYSTLPESVLVEELRNQELPLPMAILQPSYLQSVGEFWQALDGKPKAAINYRITVAVQPFADVEVPLVLDSAATLEPVAGVRP